MGPAVKVDEDPALHHVGHRGHVHQVRLVGVSALQLGANPPALTGVGVPELALE